MANGDGDQSKRPPLSQHDSDSQVSDKGQHGHHRTKTAKHHVGGGRLHARVASSKNLHKGGHGATSTAKLNRRQASPGSPDPALFAFPPTAPLSHAGGHRRATSDLNLSREASATNLQLKKNLSHTSLKRNRSKVEIIGKKSKSSTNLKSHTTGGLHHITNNNNHGKPVNTVHFNLGDDDEEEDNPEDEWVDASTSASPLLSRRTSVVSGGPQSAASSAANSRPATSSSLSQQQFQQPQPQSQPSPSPPRPQSSRSTNGTDSFRNVSTSQHSQYLTSRILERTPAQTAQPTMSTDTASVRLTSSRGQSPNDSDRSPPSPIGRIRPGSSGNKAELTSRFITKNSADLDSAPSNPDSFTGALARAANGRIEVSTSSQTPSSDVRRPKSTGNLPARNQEDSPMRGLRNPHDDSNSDMTGASDAKKTAAYVMNRTQQKLNIQRARSIVETSGIVPPHLVSSSSSSVSGGYRGETSLPRLLERTGMEYLVVRRYQNPIARSLARLAQLPGQERKLRIHKTRTSTTSTSTPTHSRQGSELRSGPVQNLRDREGTMAAGGPQGLMGSGSRGDRRPGSRRGVNGDGYGQGHGEDGDGRTGTGLSGSSLVDGGEDATTLAVLRGLWDKNVDLSASQD